MPKPLVKHIEFHSQLRSVTWEIVRQQPSETEPTREAEDVERMSAEPAENQPDTGNQDVNDVARLQELLQDVLENVRELHEKRSRSLGELQQLAVELSVAVAAHLVKKQLDTDKLELTPLVEEAISRLVPHEPVTVHMNSLDLTTLEEAMPDKMARHGETVSFVADERLPRGACRVTAGDLGLHSSLEDRLATIRDSLLQGIDYAQVERRQDDTNGGSLRRFPDRRQTA